LTERSAEENRKEKVAIFNSERVVNKKQSDLTFSDIINFLRTKHKRMMKKAVAFIKFKPVYIHPR